MVKYIYDKDNKQLLGASIYEIDEGIIKFVKNIFLGYKCSYNELSTSAKAMIKIPIQFDQCDVVYFPQNGQYSLLLEEDEVIQFNPNLDMIQLLGDRIALYNQKFSEVDMISFSPDDSILELYDYPLSRSYPSDK